MITKLCRVVTNDKGNLPRVSHDSLNSQVRSRDKQKAKFQKTPATTKLGRVETYNEGNSSIISHDPVAMWSHEVEQ